MILLESVPKELRGSLKPIRERVSCWTHSPTSVGIKLSLEVTCRPVGMRGIVDTRGESVFRSRDVVSPVRVNSEKVRRACGVEISMSCFLVVTFEA